MTKFLQFIFKIVKQNFCWHDYKYINASDRTGGSCYDFYECKKCGSIK